MQDDPIRYSPEGLPESIALRMAIDEAGHWLWTGYTNARGYGRTGFDGKRRYVHRIVWTLLVGPIPTERILHHDPACPKNCANPAHLELTTQQEHPDSAWQIALTRTHCPHGHLLDGVMTPRTGPSAGRPRRYCLTCNRERVRARYAAGKRAA